jgi:hypothetical protein
VIFKLYVLIFYVFNKRVHLLVKRILIVFVLVLWGFTVVFDVGGKDDTFRCYREG